MPEGSVFDTIHTKEINATKTFNSDLVTTQHQTPHQFTIKSNAKLGAYAHAVTATLDLQTSGSAHGLASAGTSVLIPPNGSLQRGALYSHIFEIGCQASSTWGSAGPVGFLKFDQWGTSGHFDDNALFFDIQGLNEATGHIYSEGAGALTTVGTLKCRIGGTTRYLMFASNEAN
ncbi:MAG TPA: hypothetical protein ENI22_01460 [Candidatus Pacearchaeota archaeon]|nr:hypothetical protein [Candidatus Pacearchaeota archaeon]